MPSIYFHITKTGDCLFGFTQCPTPTSKHQCTLTFFFPHLQALFFLQCGCKLDVFSLIFTPCHVCFFYLVIFPLSCCFCALSSPHEVPA